MTVPTNAFESYTAVGNREDLQDAIYRIDPVETPFLSSCAVTTASAREHEWQTQALAAAAANRAIEADDPTAKAVTATTRLKNVCQISQKTVVVSGTQESVDKAGRKSELAYQVTLAGLELKRDMEFALTQNQASSAGGAATARSLASVESWLASNKTTKGGASVSAPVTTPGYASGYVAAPTDATSTGTFVEADLKAIIRECWEDGGNPGTILCGPTAKQKISSFAGIATQTFNISKDEMTTIIGGADLYVSDFGKHMIVPDRFNRDRTVLVLDMKYWAVAYLRRMKQYPLSKTGDSEKRQLLTEYTLVSRNEKASGKVTDINGAL
jgi:hypothetical protein